MNGPAWALVAMITLALGTFVAAIITTRGAFQPARPRIAAAVDTALVLAGVGAVAWVLVAARPGSQPVLSAGATAVIVMLINSAIARWASVRGRPDHK